MSDCPPIQYARSQDGTDLAYWAMGAGPPLFLVHRRESSHLTLEWEVPSLRTLYADLARDFRVIRYNQRVDGLSSDAKDLGREATLGDITAVLDVLGLDRVHMLSIAGGASNLAAAYAADIPAKVGALVLLSPCRAGYPRGDIRLELSPQLRADVLGAFAVPEGPNEDRVAFGRLLARMSPEVRERLTTPDPAVWYEAEDDSYARVRAPSLVVDWPHRYWCDGVAVASRIPGARLVTRKGREAPPLDPDRESLLTLIRAFLEQHALDARAHLAFDAVPFASLSRREREVAILVAAGLRNPEIGQQLCISRSTVARHVSSALEKTGLSNRTQLALWASHNGVAPLE